MERPLRNEDKDLRPGQGLRAGGGTGWLQGHPHSFRVGTRHWCQVSLLFPCGLGLENRSYLFAGHARKLQSIWTLGERPCGGQE